MIKMFADLCVLGVLELGVDFQAAFGGMGWGENSFAGSGLGGK